MMYNTLQVGETHLSYLTPFIGTGKPVFDGFPAPEGRRIFFVKISLGGGQKSVRRGGGLGNLRRLSCGNTDFRRLTLYGESA